MVCPEAGCWSSQLEIFAIEVVVGVKLGRAFFLSSHLVDFLGVGKDKLSLDCAISLVVLVTVADVRLIVSVDVLHHEPVVLSIGIPVNVLGQGPGANDRNSNHITMVLQQEAPREVCIRERHFLSL